MSSTGPAILTVALLDDFVCLRVSGRATFHHSLDFKRIISELHERGHRRFVIDLSDCVIMDSTFLGILAGFGLKFDPTKATSEGSLQLLNPTPRISDLLENLGVAHLFRIITEAKVDKAEFAQLKPAAEEDRTEVTRNCLEAHQLLMRLNPENQKRFKDVAHFLAEDLKRLEGAK